MSDDPKLPSIPSLQGLPAQLQKVLAPIKSILELRAFGPAGMRWISRNEASDVVDGVVGGGGVDYSTPPQPTGLTAFGTFTNIFLEWDPPPYANHAYTEIWRATVDDLGSAVAVGAASMNVNLYVDPVDDGSTYYYWIRFVSRADVAGAYNATDGTLGETSATPTRILDALIGEITESHLFEALATDIDLLRGERVIKVDVDGRAVGIGMAVVAGESGPAGQLIIYSDVFAVVAPGAAPEDPPTIPFIVGNVNGVPTVGINGQLVVDGSIYGYSIVAETITADKLSVVELSAITANLGTVTAGAFRTAASPAYRVEITSEDAFPLWYGSGLKNATNAVFYVDLFGNAVFKGDLDAANGTFAGALQAATGTFSGTMTAAAVNAVNTINLGVDAVTVLFAANQPAQVNYAVADIRSTVWKQAVSGVFNAGSGSTKVGKIVVLINSEHYCYVSPSSGGGTVYANYRLLVNGVVRKTWTGADQAMHPTNGIYLQGYKTLVHVLPLAHIPDNSATYSVEVSFNANVYAAGGSGYVRNCVMTLDGAKR